MCSIFRFAESTDLVKRAQKDQFRNVAWRSSRARTEFMISADLMRTQRLLKARKHVVLG